MENTEAAPAPEVPKWPLPNAPTSAWKAKPSIPVPTVQKSTRSLVIDTNALIKGSRLEKLATEFYTVREVFDEVTDKQSKHQLAIFPFEIKVRSPTQESFNKGNITNLNYSLKYTSCGICKENWRFSSPIHCRSESDSFDTHSGT